MLYPCLLAAALLAPLTACSLLFDEEAANPSLRDAGPDGAADADLSEEGAVLGPIINITNGAADSTSPSGVWDGEHFRLVWESASESGKSVLAVVVDEAVSPVFIADSAAANATPAAAWTGSSMAIAWVDQRDLTSLVQLGLFDDQLSPLGELSTPSGKLGGIHFSPSIVPTGTQLGVVWTQLQGVSPVAQLARHDGDGQLIGPPVQIASEVTNVAAAFAGTEYGMAWQAIPTDVSEVQFQRVTATGVPNGDVLSLSVQGQDAIGPRVVAAGSDFAVVWQRISGTEPAVGFSFVEDGTSATAPIVVSGDGIEARSPAIIWSGDSVGIAWLERRDDQLEVVFQEFDPQGQPLGDSIQLSDGSGSKGGVSLMHNGKDFAATWYTGAVGTRLIQFRTVSTGR